MQKVRQFRFLGIRVGVADRRAWVLKYIRLVEGFLVEEGDEGCQEFFFFQGGDSLYGGSFVLVQEVRTGVFFLGR